MKLSVFRQAIHHAYAQTDGTYAWPNSREGDMLREAKKEIDRLTIALNQASFCLRELCPDDEDAQFTVKIINAALEGTIL